MKALYNLDFEGSVMKVSIKVCPEALVRPIKPSACRVRDGRKGLPKSLFRRRFQTILGSDATSQLIQYIIALSNLYGMVHKDNSSIPIKTTLSMRRSRKWGL